MDKKIGDKMIKRILILLLLLPVAFAQTAVPQNLGQCDQVTILNKVQQENQATRKFVLDTFEQKSQQFFEEADRRLTLLDEEAHAVVNEATYKLGFIWGGITLTIVSFYSLLSLMFRRRAYKKLKNDILEEVQHTIKPQIDALQEPQQQQPQIPKLPELSEAEKQANREAELRKRMNFLSIPVKKKGGATSP